MGKKHLLIKLFIQTLTFLQNHIWKNSPLKGAIVLRAHRSESIFAHLTKNFQQFIKYFFLTLMVIKSTN